MLLWRNNRTHDPKIDECTWNASRSYTIKWTWSTFMWWQNFTCREHPHNTWRRNEHLLRHAACCVSARLLILEVNQKEAWIIRNEDGRIFIQRSESYDLCNDIDDKHWQRYNFLNCSPLDFIGKVDYGLRITASVRQSSCLPSSHQSRWEKKSSVDLQFTH